VELRVSLRFFEAIVIAVKVINQYSALLYRETPGKDNNGFT